jgi:hypothetical protein
MKMPVLVGNELPDRRTYSFGVVFIDEHGDDFEDSFRSAVGDLG